MWLYKLEIIPDERMIPVALASVRTAASYFFEDTTTLERITLSLEEAIANVTAYCRSDALESILIEAGSEEGAFVVTVTDKGMPGDLDKELEGEQRLGLNIMHKLMDKVTVENLGIDGRRQRLVKYLADMPAFEVRKPVEAVAPAETTLTIRPVREEETIEVARCMYDEYGFTYPTDTVYYPERFYAATQTGDMYSLVAVNAVGEIAAHLSLWRWSILPGIWEMGMGVVKRRFRQAKIFTGLADGIIIHARDVMGLDAIIVEPVLHHPYSQKTFNRVGACACGVGLSYVPTTLTNTINQTQDKRGDVAIAMVVFKREPRTLYLHPELCGFIEEIAGRMELPVKLVTEPLLAPREQCVTVAEAYQHMQLGRIAVYEVGKDIAARLHSLSAQLKRQNVEVIELFLRIDEPGARNAYEAAKKLGYFCTGFLPMSGRGDMLMMENLYAHTVDYDAMQTVEPYTGLLARIRAFDPNETHNQ